MDINRNQWFLAGLVFLFLGLQFRMIVSFVVKAEVAKFLGEVMNKSMASAAAAQTVTPGEWIGWALLAIGATMVLHALSLPKPSG